jgi:hypothetical protein
MPKTKKVLKRKILDEVEINRRSGHLGPEGLPTRCRYSSPETLAATVSYDLFVLPQSRQQHNRRKKRLGWQCRSTSMPPMDVRTLSQ